MRKRTEQLSAEQDREQLARKRSWSHAQQALADPLFRAFLEESIGRVNNSHARPITRAEFLAQTEIDPE